MESEEEIKELKELIKGERVFLHDLSNSLLVAQGMGGFVAMTLKKTVGEDAKEYQRMTKVAKAVDKMIDLVQDRRAALKARSD